jgi:hypothetical protein
LTSPLTMTDIDRIRQKGQRGWLEHNAGITRMSTDDLLVEARAELDDLLFYISWRSALLDGRF